MAFYLSRLDGDTVVCGCDGACDTLRETIGDEAQLTVSGFTSCGCLSAPSRWATDVDFNGFFELVWDEAEQWWRGELGTYVYTEYSGGNCGGDITEGPTTIYVAAFLTCDNGLLLLNFAESDLGYPTENEAGPNFNNAVPLNELFDNPNTCEFTDSILIADGSILLEP